MLKVKRVVIHGKVVKTLRMVRELITCPECEHARVHGHNFENKPFRVCEHKNGHPMYVVTCPNCGCCFHVELTKEGAP